MRATQFLSALAVAAVAVAFPTNEKRSSPSGKFQIYAYGDSIGGLPLFTSGGAAYLGDPSLTSSDQSAPVIFTDSDGYLKGTPNMTKVGDYKPASSWSNITFYVPSSSSSHTVGFQNSSTSTSGHSMDSFSFYGSWVGVTGSDGAWETLWYAVATDTDGVYSLQWDPTDDDTSGQTMLTLKITPPSDV